MVFQVGLEALLNGVVAGDGAEDVAGDGSSAVAVTAMVDGGDDSLVREFPSAH